MMQEAKPARRGRPPEAAEPSFEAAIAAALAMIEHLTGRDADKARVRLQQAAEHVALAEAANEPSDDSR